MAAYVAAWLGALLATDPTCGLLPLVYLFPLGLFAFVVPEHRQSGGWTVMIAVVVLYLAHGIFYFRARTRLASVILYLTLIALLLCDSAGCRAMTHPH